MASKLDQMIQPDERVLFRTARDDRKVVGRVVLAAIATGGVFAMVLALPSAWSENGFDVTAVGERLPAIAIVGGGLSLFMLIIYLPTIAFVLDLAAIATDLRVLYRPGGIGAPVVEIPLWHIAAVERTEGWIRLRDRTGKWIDLTGFPDPEGLGAAILAETGLPAPVLPKGRLKTWSQWVSNFTFCFGFAAFAGLFFLTWTLFNPMIDGLFEGLLPDNKWLGVGLHLAVTLIVTFLPGFAVSAGGAVAATLAMRPFLSAAEAGQVFDTIIYHLREQPGDEPGNHWGAKLSQWPFRTARPIAARLYGEPV